MNLRKPRMAVFWISAMLAVLALIGAMTAIVFLHGLAVWIALVAYVVLAVGAIIEI